MSARVYVHQNVKVGNRSYARGVVTMHNQAHLQALLAVRDKEGNPLAQRAGSVVSTNPRFITAPLVEADLAAGTEPQVEVDVTVNPAQPEAPEAPVTNSDRGSRPEMAREEEPTLPPAVEPQNPDPRPQPGGRKRE